MQGATESEIEYLFTQLYEQVSNILIEHGLDVLIPEKSLLSFSNRTLGIRRRVRVKIDNLGSVIGGKWIKLCFRVGNTKEEVFEGVISIFDEKESILRDLQEIRIPSDFSLWGDENILMSIEGDGPIELVIRFLLVSRAVADIDPKSASYSGNMAMVFSKRNDYSYHIDFSRIQGKKKIMVLCHGHAHGDLDFFESKNVLYVDSNPQVLPDIVSDMLDQKWTNSHSFSSVYAVGCPIYQLKEKKLNKILKNIHNVLEDDGRLFLTWYRSNFPPEHPMFVDYGSGSQDNGIYEILTDKYFDYNSFDDNQRGFLVLSPK